MIRVFQIERFATHDGEGIRSVVFFMGCPLHCPWCANPESQHLETALFHKQAQCSACHRCEQQCPTKAISWIQGRFSFDAAQCTHCNHCVSHCLHDAISLVGTSMSVEAIMQELRKDKAYYQNSNGGITISGGEPFVQFDALMELLKACHEEGFSTTVETTGQYAIEKLVKALPYIDTVLFDIKHSDASILNNVIGADNNQIQQNLQFIVSSKCCDIIVRIPVISGFNHDEQTITAILKRCSELNIKQIHLLPYHTLGIMKYEYLGMPYTYPKECVDKQELKRYVEIAAELQLHATIGG